MKNQMNQDTFPRLDAFFDYFMGVRERSPKTIREYRYDLRLFFRWLKKEKRLVPTSLLLDEIPLSDIDDTFLNEVRLQDLYRYLSWLVQERQEGASARSRKVSSLRSFFNYLSTKIQVIEQNPTEGLESPKKAKALPRYLDLSESQQLIRQVAHSDDPSRYRDYCILVLFLNCGMRLSELCGIDVNDIKDGTIRVTGKGNKERTLYLNALCLEALEHYIPHRIKPSDPHCQALFTSRNRRRISQRAVENLVKKHLQNAGLDPRRYSAHKLRHTAATLLYQYGSVDLRSLQQILGHESVATTEIYTHVNNGMLQEAVDRNPLNAKENQLEDSSS